MLVNQILLLMDYWSTVMMVELKRVSFALLRAAQRGFETNFLMDLQIVVQKLEVTLELEN